MEARRKKLLSYISSSKDFETIALEVFRYQAEFNPVYKYFISLLGYESSSVKEIQQTEQIPFLPISFFKTHKVITGDVQIQKVFQSSGTSNYFKHSKQLRSVHHVANISWYYDWAKLTFEQQHGSLSDYHLFALLPNYLERGHSSLVSMVAHFMKYTKPPSDFFLYDYKALVHGINKLLSEGKKVLLWGVRFALWELAKAYELDLSKVIVIETGGMKGKHREIMREAFQELMQSRLNINKLYAEYGMTELLSQFYALEDAVYYHAPRARIYLRDMTDPMCISSKIKRGAVNIIDLLNIDSCSFIETEDTAMRMQNGGFRLLGRLDKAEIRGCNLMV